MKGGFVMPFNKEGLLKDHIVQDDISGFLAEGTEIQGEVRFRDVLRVDGKITGKVISEKELVVGESGEVEAQVEVGTLSVSGKVTGTIHVREKLEIHPRGRVVGDITLEKPNLVIHEGGIFEGNIDMNAGRKPQPHAGEGRESQGTEV
ncbi:MAG TPA: polymer-forming cytoskeletal protein, partial [Candidatus Polarisedimenticolia bacterium]|nr:polymer-forming cytoskeletal protein [Candidatus Polarisedimenticolia bacterium]